MRKRLYLPMLLICTAALLSGCTHKQSGSLPEYNNPIPSHTSSSTISTLPETTDKELKSMEDKSSDIIAALINTMTLEEKVGQLFIAAFRKNIDGKPVHFLDGNTKSKIEKYHLGGVILFSENIDTIPQTTKLINDLQKASKVPMFIAVDEEGGRVSRIGKNARMHATWLPSSSVIGLTEDPGLAYEAGVVLGRELSSLGFNMNFAPVADVNTNPNNPVIGERSFGSHPEKVGLMVQEMVKGLQDQNVCSVLKHFPGHGDTSFDSHLGRVVIDHNMKRLRQIELVPFEKGIRAGADGVMSAHIVTPRITFEDLPATLSGKILTGLLRDELKHKKLIITDALEMKAISSYWTSSQAAVMAFKAGADIILMPASMDSAYDGILSAVESGDITEDRLNESVKRILEVKLERKILEGRRDTLNPEEILGSEEHLRLVEKIIQKAGK
ncbi:MAG: glycoside hydrolase family 3 protein [Bacillota bacterium]